MRSVCIRSSICLAVVTILFGGRLDAAPSDCKPPTTLNRAGIEADLVFLSTTLKDHWAYAEARQREGINIDGLVFDVFSSTRDTVGRSDFVRMLEQFVAGLHDGHAIVLESSGLPAAETRLPRRCPIDFASSSEGVVASTSAAGIKRGELIEEIDGIPIEKLVTELIARTPASTTTARRYWATRLLGATDALSTRLVVVDDRGTRRIVTCPTEVHGVFGQEAPIEWRVLEGNIGYLRLGSFSPKANIDVVAWLRELQRGRISSEEFRTHVVAPTLEKVRTAFASLAQTSALVMDLRGNTGGADAVGIEVAAHLVPSDETFYFLSARAPTGNWSQPSPVRIHRRLPTYSGRLAVLIDEATFSAADNLAAFIRDEYPAIFVGRPTGGGTGGPQQVTLRQSCTCVTFTTVRVFSPKGRMIEGKGTTPDIAIRWSKTDYSLGRDPDLAAALRALRAAAEK